MLIEFSASNFKSIKSEIHLSLVAGSSRKVRAHHSKATGNSKAPYVLRAGAIFGGNGSGKSTTIAALSFIRDFAIGSATDRASGSEIDVAPYKFSKECLDQPSEFEIVFLVDDDIYQLGFIVDSKRVFSEWLFLTPKGQPTRQLIDRNYDSETDSYEIKISKTLPGPRTTWKTSTRSDALVFSTAVQLNASPLLPAYNWLKESLRIVPTNHRINPAFTAEMVQGEQEENIMRFLRDVGIDVLAIDSYEQDVIGPDDLSHLPSELRSYMEKELKGQKRRRIVCYHEGDDGERVGLPYEEESDGTQALISFAGPWIDVLENGLTIVVDELDSSLHSFALRYLLESYFTSAAGEGKGGQLLFTTHDSLTMDAEVLHRDQIWLVERNPRRGTTLRPLSDYEVRSNESYHAGYLRGRYGGVPVTGPRTVRIEPVSTKNGSH
ncbi:MAG: ATP-binding protein [Brevundimonas sp.]|uniref:AAA family ATPase n=1 Tax=Brevundimonas sp. TaxID=1871086 RepID=UPI0027749501|nr:ATP-binding protein [Brevundimonas sp.]MDP3079301.1 ATP-binding protein [Brevundimonas sp.]MDZ4113030.1 ATP-binding protein [Brevundimonas sp.]